MLGENEVLLADPGTLTTIFVALFVNVAVYAISRITRRKPAITEDERTSPTYSFTGITTTRGSGHVVPIVFGTHPIGGQEIGSVVRRVEARVQTTSGEETVLQEHLDVLLSLGEGPIGQVAGISTNSFGEATEIGGLGAGLGFDPGTELWDGIRAGDNEIQEEEAKVSVRLGNLAQSIIPQFQAARSTLAVGARFDERSSNVFLIPGAEVDRCELVLRFPNGLFDASSGSPQPATVDVEVSWRRQGDQAFSPPTTHNISEDPTDGDPFTFVIAVDFGATEGPFEVKLERVTPRSSFDVSDTFVWESTVTTIDGGFEYPGLALLAVTLRASEKFQESNPPWRVMVDKGHLVRGWDSSTGFTDYTWDAESPWTFPLGSNPACVFLEVAIAAYAAKRIWTEGDIDLEKIRDWMDFCDQDDGDGLPLLRFDGVVDFDGETAWEVLQRIAAAGRAVPILLGSTLSVIYEYSGAHGRGTNSVPARTPVTLLTAGQVESFTVIYKDVDDRPNFYDVQIKSADEDYAEKTLTVEDPNASDLTRPDLNTFIGDRHETIDFFGVARPKQARREAHIYHNRNRLSETDVVLTAGIDALPVEVGDLFHFQHDFVALDGEPSFALRITSSGTASFVTFDQEVTIAADSELLLVDESGVVRNPGITASPATYPAGNAITIDTNVTVNRFAPAALGKTAKTTRTFVVVESTLKKGLKRTVRGEQWDASMLTVDPDLLEVAVPDSPGEASGPSETMPSASAITAGAGPASGTRVGYVLPEGYEDRRSRVYVRPSGGGAWRYSGETLGASLDVRGLTPLRDYQVAVAVQDRHGVYQSAAAAAKTTIQAQEWQGGAPRPVEGLGVQLLDKAPVLTWRGPVPAELDYFEVRRGPFWGGGELVGRTTECRFLIRDAAGGTQQYLVRARVRGGLYSTRSASLDVTWTAPEGMAEDVASSDLVTAAAGTHDDTVYDGTENRLELSGTLLHGVYTGAELDATTVARRWWSVLVDSWEEELELAGEATYLAGSAEAKWRTPLGREASPYDPGPDFDDLALARTEPAWKAADALRRPGEQRPGGHTRVLVEVRFHDGTSWGGWERYRAGFRIAQKMQARLTIDRQHERYRRYVDHLRLAAAW